MVKKALSDDLVRVLQRIEGEPSAKSPLYTWMMENHEAIARAFETHGPQWRGRIKLISELGLTNRSGKPLTLKTAQKTWYTVCADLKRKAEAQEARERPTGFRAKPFEMPSLLVDWTSADVSRETNHDEIAATNPAGEKI